MVDEVRHKELADGRRAPTEAYVEISGGLSGYLERFGRTGVDEVESGATCHLDRGSGVVGEHKDRGVEWRFGAPPAFPLFAGPWAALGPELVASHDFRTDARGPLAGEGVIDAPGPA